MCVVEFIYNSFVSFVFNYKINQFKLFNLD